MSQALAATLEDWLEAFIQDMHRRGYSERSRHCYRYDLLLFVGWVKEQPQLTMPGDLTAAVLEKYQIYLMLRRSLKHRRSQPRTLTAGSRNRHLAELRSFFRYLKRASKLLGNPSAELERARESKRIPKAILSIPEMARLLQAIPKDTALGLRDWAAVELLYGTGIRRNELLGLSLSDLRLAEELVHVLGKGDKERVVPLGQAARRALKRYLREGRPKLAPGEQSHVFLSGHHIGPVSDRELMGCIKKYALLAGIQKPIGFHVFRHTMATHLLRGGADLRILQEMLGHASPATTAIYTRVEISDLQKVLKRCHPREQTPKDSDPAS